MHYGETRSLETIRLPHGGPAGGERNLFPSLLHSQRRRDWGTRKREGKREIERERASGGMKRNEASEKRNPGFARLLPISKCPHFENGAPDGVEPTINPDAGIPRQRVRQTLETNKKYFTGNPQKGTMTGETGTPPCKAFRKSARFLKETIVASCINFKATLGLEVRFETKQRKK